MTKTRPCKRDCGYPALKGRQFCHWHALMRMSSDEQAEAAVDRREAQLGHDHAVFQARVPKDRWPDGERWCAGCQSFVPTFYCSGSRCKACSSTSSHAKRLEDNYGIDAAEYKRIFEAQGGRCAICRNKPRTIRFAVDHDHKSGEVRGILCKRCNHDLLGGGHDDIMVLFRAIEYLIFPPAVERPFKHTPDHVLTELRERLLADFEARRASARAARPEPQEAPF
jgi:hypothetical protein